MPASIVSLQDREHRPCHAPERGLGRAGAAQVGEVERGGDVAAAVRVDRQQRRLDRPGALVGDRDDVQPALRHVAVQHARDQHVTRPAVAHLVDRGQDLREAAGLPAGKEVELEVVRREDVGLRDHRVAHELRDAGPHEHAAADVAHHRVAAVDGLRVELLHASHGVEDDAADRRVALVSGQHRVRLAEHAAVLDPGDHLADVVGGEQRPTPRAVPRVVGEVHGEDRPDLVAQTLQREDGGGVADVAVGDRGLDGQDLHVAHPLAGSSGRAN